ncbi:MAG TPA: polysaccharide deacetylase family protein [Polyangia bacterium]
MRNWLADALDTLKVGSPILMYHGVGTPAAHGEPRYTVSRTALGGHLDALQTAGVPVVSLPALLGGDRGVCLTFDDGEATVAREAAPLVARHRFPATVYVTAGFVGTPGYLTAGALRELRDAGWTIGAHGRTHRYLPDLDPADLTDELDGARAALEDQLGAPVLHVSLPGGRGDARVTAAARAAGYVSVATSRPGLNRRVDPDGLERFAIRAGDDAARVLRLARGELRAITRELAAARALELGKRLLGNRRYEQARSRALALLGRE